MIPNGVVSIGIATSADEFVFLDLLILVGFDLTGLCTCWIIHKFGILYDADWIDNKGEPLQTWLLRRILC